FGGGGGAAPAGGATAGAAGPNPIAELVNGLGGLLQKPEGKDLLNQILKAVSGQPAAPAAAAPAAPAVSAPAVASPPPAGSTTKSLLMSSAGRFGGNGRSGMPLVRAQFIDGGIITGPAIAGLLTAVLPR